MLRSWCGCVEKCNRELLFFTSRKRCLEIGYPLLGKIPINADLEALCDNGEIEKINKNYLCGCEETLEDLNIEGDDQ